MSCDAEPGVALSVHSSSGRHRRRARSPKRRLLGMNNSRHIRCNLDDTSLSVKVRATELSRLPRMSAASVGAGILARFPSFVRTALPPDAGAVSVLRPGALASDRRAGAARGAGGHPHTIATEYRGRFVRSSDDELRLLGRYEITGTTGMFADLSGSGRIRGSLTCLRGTLQSRGAESCEDLGVFSDAVFQLSGRFEDPAVPTADDALDTLRR